MKEEELIFIVSQPRAGSTYLQNLLSNNDFVNTTSEHWLLLNYANQFNSKLVKTEFDNVLSSDAFNTFLDHVSQREYEDKFKSFILSLYQMIRGNNRYVIDKTPRYWEILDEIKETFPQAKIIILKRDPANVLRSIINTWNKTTLRDLNPYKRDLLLGPKALHNFSIKYKNDPNVKVVNYEKLLLNLSSIVQDLYNWLEIPFDSSNLFTDNNSKIRGKYGDPFQNSESTYQNSKSKAIDLVEGDPNLNSFIEKYKNFLGDAFLKEYGDYNGTKIVNVSTDYDSYFDLRAEAIKNLNLLKEINDIKKSNSYRLAKIISSPIRFLKSLY